MIATTLHVRTRVIKPHQDGVHVLSMERQKELAKLENEDRKRLFCLVDEGIEHGK